MSTWREGADTTLRAKGRGRRGDVRRKREKVAFSRGVERRKAWSEGNEKGPNSMGEGVCNARTSPAPAVECRRRRQPTMMVMVRRFSDQESGSEGDDSGRCREER